MIGLILDIILGETNEDKEAKKLEIWNRLFGLSEPNRTGNFHKACQLAEKRVARAKLRAKSLPKPEADRMTKVSEQNRHRKPNHLKTKAKAKAKSINSVPIFLMDSSGRKKNRRGHWLYQKRDRLGRFTK